MLWCRRLTVWIGGLGFEVDGNGVLSLSDALTVTSTVSVVVAVSDGDYRSLSSSRLTVGCSYGWCGGMGGD